MLHVHDYPTLFVRVLACPGGVGLAQSCRPCVGERNERAFVLIFDVGRHGQPANGSRAVRDKDKRFSGRRYGLAI